MMHLRLVLPVIAILAFIAPAVPAQEKADAQGYVNFTFDQIEVRNFVKLVGEITGRRFIVNSDVDGKITVISPKVPMDQVYPMSVSILQSIGCSVVEDSGGVYRVVNMSASPSAPVVGADEGITSQGLVWKVIRLEFVTASEIQKALETMIKGSKEGTIAAIESTNHLLVLGTGETVRRIEKIIDEVDRPGSARTTDVVLLKYANAFDVARQMIEAMAGGSSSGQRGDVRVRGARSPGASSIDTGFDRATVVASPQANSLILVGTSSQIEELKKIVSLVDVETASGAGRLNAIFLKYISAEDAAKSMNALLSKQAARSDGANAAAAAPSPLSPGRIGIEPHAANNALLVDASSRDFEWVKSLVDQLDQPLEQVLIEVVIAEMSLSDGFNWNVRMAAVPMPTGKGKDAIQGASAVGEGANELMSSIQSGVFPNGLSVGVAHGISEDNDGNVSVAYPGVINLDAVKSDARFRILSSVPLLGQNNKEASVSIVNNIPILKSTISGGSGTARDIIQNIERIDVGIKLKLTPHVNPDKEVVMTLNPSIEAILSKGTVGDGLAPTIARREISTTVTVPDGQTIVLSGLMREDETESVRRIPILGHIPLIGWLFRQKSKSLEKTNLIVFVTPHVVTDDAAAQAITKQWQDKTSLGGTPRADNSSK